MGNREDLLAGARRCLREKGYARTTVRDISTAAGVSMAAIGYHFGSKEALLTEALAGETRDWGAELERALADSPADDPDPLRRWETRWDAVLGTIATHPGVWSATFDALAAPETREQLAAGADEARSGLARLLNGDEESDDRAAATVGALTQALLIGVAAQYLIDPGNAPTGRDLADGLRRIMRQDPGSGAPPRE
ncbi:AcrR family transcriptional regulator [Nocardia transvalensis]|uniref:AcrR family transcriptional regulator n=1 Tax=Nocardia transvalensis TaxID=37333 RepID=A0A7W9PKK4_9NOCA|nr:TetR/AcrR family transcriptional regulator [Nocardia transvalensis]MBB5917590.1 AcrR family transcriptional regulator [Nocardia transvalensis]